MTGLTIGLYGLSAAVLTRALAWPLAGQLAWSLAAVTGLTVFLAAPRPFAEVAVWAATCLALWVADRSEHKGDLLAAALAGGLIAATSPWLGLVTEGRHGLPAGTAEALGMALALTVGAALAAVPGAALALVTGALPLGLLANPAVATGIVCLSLVVGLGARQRQPMIALLLFPIPVLAFLGGMT